MFRSGECQAVEVGGGAADTDLGRRCLGFGVGRAIDQMCCVGLAVS